MQLVSYLVALLGVLFVVLLLLGGLLLGLFHCNIKKNIAT
jgi:uncharacterized membrane protein YciS (DUF1049 family)